MKRKKICLSRTTLALVPITSLLLVLILFNMASGKIEPVGTKAGGIQFDAVIELHRYSPRSSHHEYTLIFARYWVTCDYYSIGVVWAEPQSTDFFFAVRPPTLSVVSNEQEFKINHELVERYNKIFQKPLGERGVFRHKFGSYPIDNIRFAEKEALLTRIYSSDLADLKDIDQANRRVLQISIPSKKGEELKDVIQLQVESSGQRIDSIRIFDTKSQLLKCITYDHEEKDGNPCLNKQTIILPEQAVMVGFKGEGMKVTLDGKQYRYRELEATHHAGGRRCIVEYDLITLSGKEMALPVYITVRNEQDGRILRSVRLMNYKRVDLDVIDAEQTAKRFGGFNADQHKYWAFRSKYWDRNPSEVERKDIETIKNLRDRCDSDWKKPENTIGEKLKALNVLMGLNLILGEESELERNYQHYLSTLADRKLLKMVLVGGYGVIETLMFQNRQTMAGKLLGRWVNIALDTNDDESILLFAKRQFVKKRFWTTIVLLEAFIGQRCSNDAFRFEAEVMKCCALDKLCKLLRTNDIDKKGLLVKIQKDWISHMSMDDVEKMFIDSKEWAKKSFVRLNEPTESQKELKEHLDKIDKKKDHPITP